MLQFGFELEGFYEQAGVAAIPPKSYPTDGFPGLVELRTTGGQGLRNAYADIIRLMIETPDVNFSRTEAVFTGQQRAELRRRHSEKSTWDIQNIYGRVPRLLGNRTLASCQISISSLIRPAYRDDKGVQHTNKWGLFDIPKIVRALDKEFAAEIAEARRQPGEYCIKDGHRLECRSLPNAVFPITVRGAAGFMRRLDPIFV